VSVVEKEQTETTPSRRRSIWFLVALLLIVALVGVLAFGLRPKTSTVLAGQPAPDFELTAFNGDFEGQDFRLDELRGQPVVLNFWASWCAPCQMLTPILHQVTKKPRPKSPNTTEGTPARLFIPSRIILNKGP